DDLRSFPHGLLLLAVALPSVGSLSPKVTHDHRDWRRSFCTGSIHKVYPENDDANAAKIRETQGDFRAGALERFATAGWRVEVANSRLAKASPTPRSVLLGAGIDGMPVVDTVLELCVLLARGSA
ncbi:MAG: hypothetical protein ABIL09_17805, partial [Gemmatimonadota bacterium]